MNTPPPFSVPQGMETSIKTVIIHELINMFNTERGRHGCVRKMVVCTCACRSNYEIWGILNGMVNNGPPTSTNLTTTSQHMSLNKNKTTTYSDGNPCLVYCRHKNMEGLN